MLPGGIRTELLFLPPGCRLAGRCVTLADLMFANTEELRAQIDGSDRQEMLCRSNIRNLHPQNAETSAIMPKAELASLEVGKAATFVSERMETWLLIFTGKDERDSFVGAMQVLQLYHALAEHYGISTPKKGETMDHVNEGFLLRPRP